MACMTVEVAAKTSLVAHDGGSRLGQASFWTKATSKQAIAQWESFTRTNTTLTHIRKEKLLG